MKKSKILLIIASLITLAGCNTNNTNRTDKVEVIADFEQWKPDFSSITLSYGFGKITRNDVQKFVKSGKYSANVRPMGHEYRKDIVPAFYFPLQNKTLNFNKGDLRKYTKMTCSFYNDSNYDVPLKVGFVQKIETIYNIQKVEPTAYTLKANSWNEIEYDININFLNMYFNIEEAPGLYFEFEYQGIHDISFAPDLYVDDVVFHKADQIREVNTAITLKEYEICDFEDDLQKSFMSVRTVNNGRLSFDFVGKDGDVEPTSGNKMLKIHSYAQEHWVNWTHFIISEPYMKQTALKDISLEEAENQMWAFCYDIRVEGMQNGADDQFIAPTFFTTNGQNELYIGGQERRAEEGVWKTVKLIFNKEYEFDGGVKRTITIDYLTRIGAFHFSCPDEIYDYDIYIDNMRIEKVTTE